MEHLFLFLLIHFASHSFDPSVVIEQPASLFFILATGTLSLGIVSFPELASLGASFSCLLISIFALDGSSIPTGPFDSSNFSFPSLIRL